MIRLNDDPPAIARPWGSWTPRGTGELDPATIAVLSVLRGPDGQLAALEVGCGPLLAGASEARIVDFVLDHVEPEVDALLAGRTRHRLWTQTAPDQWQTALVDLSRGRRPGDRLAASSRRRR